MKSLRLRLGLVVTLIASGLPGRASDSNTGVHTTWLWHLHQPVYWPDRRTYGTDHYENAWDTIQQQNAGRGHPNPEALSTVFSVADRINAYQGGPSGTVNNLRGYPNAGAQLNYSGALMENVQSLASAGQYGYGSGWNNGNAAARTWTTSGGKPRLDIVNFTYHHAIAPLVSAETLAMELKIQQRQMQIFWGSGTPLSRGYFPAETCFAEHIIPVLNQAGIAWSVVANNHLARTCADAPVPTGSGGEMCDLPNLADQLNPAQGGGNYQRLSIDRGCAPLQAMPFGFQPHYARYVDPNTGNATQLIVVPSDQVFGWKDSYSTWDLGLIAPLAARNNTAHPALVLCAHDGDNAWSGGSSYYNEWVGQMASSAAADGYEPDTIEQFLADFPPATGDVVHVENGGWVFADSDFGSPSFINWNWPPSYTGSNGKNVVDPSLGVTSKGDNWRVIIATENRVKTAQQISGVTPVTDQVRDPGSFSGTPSAVDLGWHYYLGGLDSGFVYYGCNGDECLRAIVAQSNACRNVDSLIAAHPGSDTTPPTVFLPQRHPWNPGGTNFGCQYGYTLTVATNSDFWVWTYAYDVSGITNLMLYLRNDGTNPPAADQFKTYAGGSLTGSWQGIPMNQRVAANSSGYTPKYQADYYYSYVTGISNAFVDYYVSATDAYGNTYKTPLQHVWVAAGSTNLSSGGGGSSGNGVSVNPNPPVAGNSVTITYTATGRALASYTNINLHLGWNGWSPVVTPDAPMTYNAASNGWQITVTVTNLATTMNCCFNNGSGVWDNNGGGNWNFTVATNSTPQPPATPVGLNAAVASASAIALTWSAASGATGYQLTRGGVPFATPAGTSYTDTGLTLGSNYCYTVAATNSVGSSSASSAVCLALQTPATPAGLAVTGVTTNQISLAWSAAAGATAYLVSRDSAVIATTTGTSYSDPGLAPNSSHCYFLIASNLVGLSSASATLCTNTLAAATNNPGGGTNLTSLTSGAVTVTPVPAAGSSTTIRYTATGRVLAGATNVYLHLGWNNWNPAVSPDAAMTFNSASNGWQVTVAVPVTASNLNCCFNNGGGTWDNNTTTNWNFPVTGTIPAFVLDGNFDYTNYVLASSGMVLYGAVRGTTLYVATWSSGTNGLNDHFIFVTDQLLPAATAAAPWAKAGLVAVTNTKPFLGAAGQDNYISWYVNNAATNWPCAKAGTNSGAMTGTIDLPAAFGYLPTNLYLCAAAYINTNGGPLVAQCPPGTGANLNPTNFFVLPVAAAKDSLGNGTFDLCDPARGFKVLAAARVATNCTLNFAAMPGRTYQVQFANNLGQPWTNLPAGSNYALPPNMSLTVTDAPPAGVTHRYYRVQLLR